ncbi:MAG: hypothetical protein ACR2RA_17470 [Geminicoccaceae bacterium]
MRWTILVTALALSACGVQKEDTSPYLSLVEKDDLGPSGDAVFEKVEDHARCAGFHRASAELASGTKTKVAFYEAVANDAETAAIQLASAKISKDLAADMVDQMAKTHAARWSYLIASDSSSDAVKRQATTCFDMANEQEQIIREVVKSKYGFGARR